MKKLYLTLEQIPHFVATELKPLVRPGNIITLKGSLGAGKTTITKELLKQCGVNDVVTSPTFSYVNTYKNAQGQTFYHFDLYRLESLNDFIAMGFDENLAQPNSLSIIEWPEVISDLLKPILSQIITVSIDHNPSLPGQRTLLIS